MRIRFSRLFVFLSTSLFLLSAVSCKKETIEDPDVVISVDPEFLVDLFELRNPVDGSPELGFWVETISDYPCSEGTFLSQVLEQDGAFRLVLDEVVIPDSCPTTSGPVSDFVPLGELSSGVSPLTFSIASALNSQGELLLQEDVFEWVVDKEVGIEVLNRVVNRIPDGLIWGYAAPRTEQEVPKAHAFINDLKAISTDHNLPVGFYSYFTVTGTGLITPHRSFDGGSHFFVRRISMDQLPALEALLNAYRDTQQTPIELKCLSTYGEF